MPPQLTELTATPPTWYGLLALAGMEFIFFIVAHTVLCFGFVLKQC